MATQTYDDPYAKYSDVDQPKAARATAATASPVSSAIKQKQELQWALFPEGLTCSHEKRFFEPANVSLMQAFRQLFDSMNNIGVPDWI